MGGLRIGKRLNHWILLLVPALPVPSMDAVFNGGNTLSIPSSLLNLTMLTSATQSSLLVMYGCSLKGARCRCIGYIGGSPEYSGAIGRQTNTGSSLIATIIQLLDITPSISWPTVMTEAK